ncbi:hypothetical protein ABE10_12590 [Bacillus toyonensis]|nr:hypothetical protein [Bacillus toyonensis]
MPPLLIIDAGILLSPLLDGDEVFNRLHDLHGEVRAWAKGDLVVLFPSAEVSSRETLALRDRLALSGLSIAIRGVHGSIGRTRMLWHVTGEMGEKRSLGLPLRADRKHEIRVPLGDAPPWETLTRLVAQYGALMAFPTLE